MSHFILTTDGGQDTLPPNMVFWHVEYFKLKEFDKQHVQEGLSDLPLKQI